MIKTLQNLTPQLNCSLILSWVKEYLPFDYQQKKKGDIAIDHNMGALRASLHLTFSIFKNIVLKTLIVY